MTRLPRERQVARNTDKPHRCPRCHAVATWDLNRGGPRTKVWCPVGCRVWWRYGARGRKRRRGLSRRLRSWHGWWR